MYLDHFGLQGYPFAPTPDPERFFPGGGRGDILNALRAAILADEGFIQLIAPPGSGKTMLCRVLCQQLPPATHAALLLNPNLPPEALIPAILGEFRFPVPNRNDPLLLRQTLLNQLALLHRNGTRALLLIDEAHAMPLATLEELRLLGNMETGRAKLLQVILFAQPVFEQNLQSVPNHPFLDRVTTRLTLEPLTAPETAHYLNARLQSAGFQGKRIFTPMAAWSVHLASSGCLHRINRLANRALQRACADSSRVVKMRHALWAARQDSTHRPISRRFRPVLATAGVVTLLAAGVSSHPWTSLSLSLPSPMALMAERTIQPQVAERKVEPERTIQPQVAERKIEPERTIQPQVAERKIEPERTIQPQMAERKIEPERTIQPQMAERKPDPQALPSPLPRAPEPVVAMVAPQPETKPPAPLADPTPEEKTVAVPDEVLFLADASGKPDPADQTPASSTLNGVPYLKPNDPLKEAILASHRWLEQSNDQHHTIQLVQLRHENGLQNLADKLAAIQPSPGPMELKLFRLKDNSLLIHLNECPTAVACEALMNRLPLSLRSSHPSVRSLARLKTTVQKLALIPPVQAG
ncbi:MAG: AAA family ATPase [Magnetococcales bacterium]|nr:AAA family ATPase [Magnetococcales bacterium]